MSPITAKTDQIMLLFVQIYDCDLVILAMGFLGPEKYISTELDLKLDPRSNYETPVGKYCTSHPKVFAAGGKFVTSAGFICENLFK